MQGTKQGTISFYKRVGGWGFCVPDDENAPDVFVHVSHLIDRKFLRAGDRIEYEIGERNGKPLAVNVRVIADAPVASVAVTPERRGNGNDHTN